MSIKRRGELFRNTRKGKIAGVCAGIADYFGWETWLVRIFVISSVLLGAGFIVVVYIAGWFILDKAPQNPSAETSSIDESMAKARKNTSEVFDEASIKVKSRVWQAGEPPKQAFHDIRRKFTKLERELQKIERYVTSPEFTVSREINKL